MRRPVVIALAVAVVGLGGVATLGFLKLAAVMPSYLAAWLVLLALPVGALPVVMGLELFDSPETPILRMLRRFVAMMPLAALLAVPVLMRARGLYLMLAPGSGGSGLPGWWMTPKIFIFRAVLFLAVWCLLAVVFSRRRAAAARPRRAALGMMLHLVVGTLAAIDWTQALEPAFVSSASGLVLMLAQSGIAMSLGVAMTAWGGPILENPRPASAGDHLAVNLAVLLAVWGFVVFTQYLVVWSANLPNEVAWYLRRSAGFGQAAEDAAGLLCLAALICLLPRGLARRSGWLAFVAAGLVVLHGVEMFWLVTPAFRSEFSITPADLLAFAGMGGLGVGTALLLGGSLEPGRAAHGAS